MIYSTVRDTFLLHSYAHNNNIVLCRRACPVNDYNTCNIPYTIYETRVCFKCIFSKTTSSLPTITIHVMRRQSSYPILFYFIPSLRRVPQESYTTTCERLKYLNGRLWFRISIWSLIMLSRHCLRCRCTFAYYYY